MQGVGTGNLELLRPAWWGQQGWSICPATCCSGKWFHRMASGQFNSFSIQQIFIECLVCTRHFCRFLRYIREQNEDLDPWGADNLEGNVICYVCTVDEQVLKQGLEPRVAGAVPLALLSPKQKSGRCVKIASMGLWTERVHQTLGDPANSSFLSPSQCVHHLCIVGHIVF